MPRFYHSDDPDLSDLNRAKKRVNADYAKQYQSQDGNHDNLGQTADVDSIYNTLSTRLTSLQGALQDLYNILEVGTSGNPQIFSPTLVANFQQFASRVLNEIQAIQLIMGRIKNFNIFTPPQAQDLGKKVADISALDQMIAETLAIAQFYVRGDLLSNSVDTYKQPMQLLLQFLNGASNNYKAVEPTRPVEPYFIEGAGRGGVAFHYHPIIHGGAIVPAYNGEGVYGSDGYRVGDYFSYTDPRRFF